MEFQQITLTDWLEMKQKLKLELQGVKQSFVRIGYMLRRIDDQKAYESDGYKSIAEFAKAEYGLEPSTTSRFMSINREYSIDGYSEHLKPEYADLGRSQLEEMLKLPDSDRQMIQPETSREDIRDLKRFNKTEPEMGVADDINQLVEKFYQDNPDVLNRVFSEVAGMDEQGTKRLAEIVNPSGSRSYRKGIYFLMMYEDKIKVKKFGGEPRDMTWWEFLQTTMDIFGDKAAGPGTWQNYFGGEKDVGQTGDSIQGMGREAYGRNTEDVIQPVYGDVGAEKEGGAGKGGSGKGTAEIQDADGRLSTDRMGCEHAHADESGRTEGTASGSGKREGNSSKIFGGTKDNVAAGRSGETTKPERAESLGEGIAPAQKPAKNQEKERKPENLILHDIEETIPVPDPKPIMNEPQEEENTKEEEQLPGQAEITDYPECLPAETLREDKNIIDAPGAEEITPEQGNKAAGQRDKQQDQAKEIIHRQIDDLRRHVTEGA